MHPPFLKRCPAAWQRTARWLVPALVSGVVPVTGVRAQPVAADAAPGLDLVTVTAQKYAQSAQDVPASLQIVDEAALGALPAATLESVATQVQGLVVDRASGGIPRVFIRGIGDWMDQQNKRVAVFVDGVPQPEAYLQDPLLPANTARVEVLKGPQGTLYGRGAVGGVINLVSQRPREAGSHAALGLGSRQQRDVDFTLNRPLSDGTWFIGLDARRLTSHGELHNVADGARVGDQERERARVRLDGRLGQTDMLLSVSRFDDRTAAMRMFYIDAAGRPVRITGFGLGGAPLSEPLARRQIDNDVQGGGTRTRGTDVTLDLQGEVNGTHWRSITSVLRTRLHQVNDADGTSLAFMRFHHDPYEASLRQFYQEVNVRRPFGDLLLQGGASLVRQQSVYGYQFDMAAAAMALGNRQRADSFALFADGEYAVSDSASLLAGLRVQKDRYRMTDLHAAAGREKSDQGSALDYRIGGRWTLAGGAQPYVTWSTAHTPGGINTSPATAGPASVVGDYLPYAPESIRSLEAGIKGGAAEGVRYALAAYRSELTDMQQYNPANTQYQNLGKALYQGVDVQLQAALPHGFEASLGYGLVRSRIVESVVAAEVDRRIGGIAQQQARLGLAWTGQVAEGRLRAALAVRLQSSRFADNANTLRLPGLALVDAQLRWESRRTWVALAATNLTQRAFYSQAFAASAFVPGFGQASWAMPRTVTLQAGWKF